VASLVDKEQQTVWSNLQSCGDFLICHEPFSTCPSQARETERAGLLPDEDGTAPAPRASWPTTWNEFLPISMPITAIAVLGV
jgi:hypothetical protein